MKRSPALVPLGHDHVRFEERELFQLLEARLEPSRLSRLGREVELAESQF